MSSLNDNADEDLTFDDLFTSKTTINPEDNTDEVNPDQPLTNEKTTIVATDNKTPRAYPEAEELFGSPLIKNELPNFNSTFVDTTNNSINLIKDLMEVRNEITVSNGVSKEDAVIIDNLVPGLGTNDKKPLGFYTEEKSKTQFAQTVATLSTEIEARIQTVGSSIIDFLDKAVEKYNPVIKLLDQTIIDKICSLQLEIQSLTLQTNGKDINEILEFHPASYRDPSDDEFNKFKEPVKQSLIDLQQCFHPGSRSFSDKLSAIYYNQLYDLDELYFPLGNSSNTYLKLIDKQPFIEDINSEIDYSPSNECAKNSLYFHSTLASGPKTLEQIKTLIGFVAGVISYFPEYKELIKNTINDNKLTKDKLLEQLIIHGSANARDGLAIINVVNFLGDFICYLEKLKAVYSAIIDSQKNTNVSTESKKEILKKIKLAREGFFDLFKKKNKEEQTETKNNNNDFKDQITERYSTNYGNQNEYPNNLSKSSLKEIIKDIIKQVEDNTEDQIKVTYNKLNDSFKLDQLEKELLLLKKCRDINLKYLKEYPKWLNSYYKALSKIPRNRDEILKIYAKCCFEADSLISKEYKTLPNLKKEVTNNEKIVTSKNNIFKIILPASALETARETTSFDEYVFVTIPYLQIKILSEDKPEETGIQINKKNLLNILNTLHELCDVEQEFNETPLNNSIKDVAFDLQELSKDSRDDEDYVTMGYGAGEDYYQGFLTNILFQIEHTIETLFKKINIKF